MSHTDAPEITDAIRVYVANMAGWSDAMLGLLGMILRGHQARGVPPAGLTGQDCALLEAWVQYTRHLRSAHPVDS